MAVAIFDEPNPHRIQVFAKANRDPNVIGLTTYGRPAECNDADSIVWPTFDEFARDFANRIDTRCFLSADCKILRQHRSGDVQRENNVDSAGFDLSKTFASCGRASAITKTAIEASNSDRRIFPARAALCFPIGPEDLLWMKKSAQRLALVFRANTRATELPGATGAATDARRFNATFL